MPSPSLTLRKPSPSPSLVRDFVNRGDDDGASSTPATDLPRAPSLSTVAPPAPPTDVPSFTRASRSLAERRTKPHRRRTTVYFDLDVARDLASKLGSDEDMSDVVNAAVRAFLASR